MVAFFPDLESLSETSVLRARNKLKLHWLPARLNCAVTEQSRIKRVAWCQQQQELETDWSRVIFSDESWFELGTNRQWLWRHHYDNGPDVMIENIAFPEKVMVWGAIGEGFKSDLVFIQGNVTGDSYLDDIICGSDFIQKADAHYGQDNWVLMQDNARPHIKKTTIKAMEDLGIKILQGWPPYSPDLNIIETVWAIMKRRIRDIGPKSIDDLKKICLDVWNSISNETIHGLVSDMPNRLISVIRNNGYTCSHF